MHWVLAEGPIHGWGQSLPSILQKEASRKILDPRCSQTGSRATPKLPWNISGFLSGKSDKGSEESYFHRVPRAPLGREDPPSGTAPNLRMVKVVLSVAGGGVPHWAGVCGLTRVPEDLCWVPSVNLSNRSASVLWKSKKVKDPKEKRE